jgi:hypothetical protein
MALDIETGRQRPTDRDGDEIPSDIDMDDDGDGILDAQEEMFEDDGYGVEVFDSISADFDADEDGIPAKIDNVYGDGEKVDKMNYFNDISRKGDDMGYDIKYIRSKTDVKGGDTTTKPKTKEPITVPKEKPGPWTTPTTVPNPQTTPKAEEKGNKKGNNTPKPKRLGRIGYYK